MSGMTRRRFLKTGAGGIIIAGIPGVLRIIQPAASAALREDIVNLKEYYNHFGVDEKIILDVMQTALDRGGDYCDIYFQHRIANWVRVGQRQQLAEGCLVRLTGRQMLPERVVSGSIEQSSVAQPSDTWQSREFA